MIPQGTNRLSHAFFWTTILVALTWAAAMAVLIATGNAN